MTLEDYLNICPRCGEKPLLYAHVGRPGYSIECKCRLLDIDNDNIDMLIDSWNKSIEEDM